MKRKEIMEAMESYDLLEEHVDLNAVSSIYSSDDEDEIDISDLREEIEDYIRESVQVIYYSNAISYLQNNDPSLRYSLDLAHELGYTIDKVNSELLASLLLQDNLMDELNEFIQEIE